MVKPHKFRQLVKILREYDSRFEVYENRAKGSERMIYHPDIEGRPESYPIKCHGKNTELSKGMIKSILRRFKLPDDLL